jgi:hypothetical protein
LREIAITSDTAMLILVLIIHINIQGR